MTRSPNVLREQIRRGEIVACGHGDLCQCAIRRRFEDAVERIYAVERREEALQEIVRLSEEMGLYDDPISKT